MRWIFAGVLFLSAIVQAFLSSIRFMEMIDAVNHRLGDDKQISQIGANVRMFEINRLYRAFYPDGKLRSKSKRLGVGAATCFITAVLVVLTR